MKFTADLGTTEIDSALDFSYKLKKFDHSPKMVFMLTDGDVSNPDSVISLARKNSKSCRTYTIGVGSGASSYLVREIAKHGRGKHIMIKESNMIAEKVIGLLQVSLSPVLDDFKFKFDEEIVEFMTPGPNTPINILKNEPINMFVFLNEKFHVLEKTIINMSYFDSVTNKVQNLEIVIDRSSFKEGDLI